MWGLNNTSQSSTEGGNPGTAGNDIRAEQAWNTTTGSRSVVVGVVDTGIDVNHGLALATLPNVYHDCLKQVEIFGLRLDLFDQFQEIGLEQLPTGPQQAFQRRTDF